jgi:LysR family glycine cleavage system transcriptional activator
MRLPSLKFLKTFQVAARLQSFKAAAEELFVTPSAISHQIKALEEQLGVSLFQRGVRTLTLTDAGRNYLEHINDIFSKLESVTEQLQVRYGRTIIRLNVPSFFANELLLPRLASFSQAREETDIRIETTFSAPKTHPPEADLSIVVGAGPLGRSGGARIVRAKFHCRLLSGVLVGQPHRYLCRPQRQDFAPA